MHMQAYDEPIRHFKKKLRRTYWVADGDHVKRPTPLATNLCWKDRRWKQFRRARWPMK